MSNRRWRAPAHPFRIVQRITRDLRIPWFEGADTNIYGWHAHQLPPDDPFTHDWEVFRQQPDRKTEWFRRCSDFVVETRPR